MRSTHCVRLSYPRAWRAARIQRSAPFPGSITLTNERFTTDTTPRRGVIRAHTGKITRNVALEINRDQDLPEPKARDRTYLTHAELLRLARATERFEALTLVWGTAVCGSVRRLRYGVSTSETGC